MYIDFCRFDHVHLMGDLAMRPIAPRLTRHAALLRLAGRSPPSKSPGSGLEFILFQCRELVLGQSYHTRFPQSLTHQISLQLR